MYQNVYITLQEDLVRNLAKTMSYVQPSSQFYILKTKDIPYCKAVADAIEVMKEKDIQIIEESNINPNSTDFEIDLKRFITQIPAINKKNLFIIAKTQCMYNFCSKNLTFLKITCKEFIAKKTYLTDMKLEDDNQMTFEMANELFDNINKDCSMTIQDSKKKIKSGSDSDDTQNGEFDLDKDISKQNRGCPKKKRTSAKNSEKKNDQTVNYSSKENIQEKIHDEKTTDQDVKKKEELSDDEKKIALIGEIFKTEDIYTAKQLLTSLLKKRLYNNINKHYTSQILSDDMIFEFIVEVLKSENYNSFVSSWRSQARMLPDQFDEFIYNDLLLQASHYEEITYLLWDKEADRWDSKLKDSSLLSKII